VAIVVTGSAGDGDAVADGVRVACAPVASGVTVCAKTRGAGLRHVAPKTIATRRIALHATGSMCGCPHASVIARRSDSQKFSEYTLLSSASSNVGSFGDSPWGGFRVQLMMLPHDRGIRFLSAQTRLRKFEPMLVRTSGQFHVFHVVRCRLTLYHTMFMFSMVRC
jgi:hypothetical protein